MAIQEEIEKHLSEGLLTREEMLQVQGIFLDVFDTWVGSYVTEGDTTEIINHVAKLHAELRLHLLLTRVVIENYSNMIFSNHIVRGFHLELADRLSVEITPLGRSAYQRLVNTLAVGVTSTRAVRDTKGASSFRVIDPVLTSIEITLSDARRSYFENPWLVGLTLIALWFKKTTLAEPLRTASIKRSTKQ